ncbi:MAG: sigma-70 family RNA polymerase sigma factor [Firmicutes bacterium]|nr:sigma-70 family RNA polymerase sigma factor [Bacillota bacterium]
MNKRHLLETFLNDNLDRAYRLAYTYTKEAAAAEDVVSDSVVKALANIDTLQKPEMIKSWFFRIVVNTALSWLRKEKRLVYFEGPEQMEQILPGKEDSSDLTITEFLDLLEPKYRTVIVLRFFEDLSLQEIAEVTGENLNTVKTRLYRGLKLLRMEMEETNE